MPIKRRSILPDPKTQATEDRTEGATNQARHPQLQGQRYDVYAFIEGNPGCIRDEVSRQLGMKSSTATARVKELIDEGYIWEPPARRAGRSGVLSKTLAATERKTGASPLDRVQIEVELTIDCNGNYGARASVVGAPSTAPHSTTIQRKRLTLTAPHPDTYSRPTNAPNGSVSILKPGEKRATADDIIEGDFTTIS